MSERLEAGDTLVLFPEGTSSDGRRVLPFKTSFFASAGLPGVLVQPVSLAYRGHRNLPMNRRLLPSYAWYGEMALLPHLLAALNLGPIEVAIVFHSPLSLSGEKNRKQLAQHAENEVRRGLALALHDPGRIG
jgi:1-acyl-sn-glycerol-3-phosphate acyltransferase